MQANHEPADDASAIALPLGAAAARAAVADAIEAWAERDAVASEHRADAVLAAVAAGDDLLESFGRIVVRRTADPAAPDPWADSAPDGAASSLGLTREVKSTSVAYLAAALRVTDALSHAGMVLQRRLAAASRGAWSRTGFERWLRADKALGLHKGRAERVRECTTGKVGVPVFRCAAGCHGEVLGVPMGCNARICPRCAPKLRRAAQAKVLDLLAHVDEVRKREHRFAARWRFVTLTVRSRDAFEPMRRFVGQCWGKLQRRRFWQRSVSAAIAFFETTHTAAGWHVHVHALVDAFIDRTALVDAWQDITNGEGTGAGVHVSLPKGSRKDIARELAKYCAKDLAGAPSDEGPWGVAGTAERLSEFYLGSIRWRTMRTYGDAYRAQAELDDGKLESALLCPHCAREVVYDRTRWFAAAALVRADLARRHRTHDPP